MDRFCPVLPSVLSSALLFACVSPALAQEDGFTLSGNVRIRYEALDGQARAGLDDRIDLTSLRTILAADYRAGPIHLGAELWDSRAWGGHPGEGIGTGEVNTLEPVQAYVAADLGPLLGRGSKTSVQIGRFLLNLGSRRLVAADDYRNTTNGYSGARIDIATARGGSASLIYVLPQMRRPDDEVSVLDNDGGFDRESFDLRLWGGYAAQKLSRRTMIELGYFGLAERDAPGRPTRNRHLHSMSLRLIRDPAPARLDYEVEGIWQMGRVRTDTAPAAASLDVAAWFFHADAGYSFPGAWKVRLSAEVDYASGDRRGGSYGRFDTLFGMRRADFVPAGIFAQTGRANILTPGLRIEMAPGKRIDLFANWHSMWLASRTDAFSTTGVRDPSGRSGRFAGHMVDSRLRWWAVPKKLRAELNASWLGKGRFLHYAPNAPRSGDARYISLALTASF
ncbi:alginate export family protein [Sphingobium lactosutens]|uniref:alginate export family protein n=1 Tax=Sphingobium lactosutens TaxID=522773 RepID=UPI0035692CE4